MIIALRKWGNSKAVVLPAVFIKEMNLGENDQLELIKDVKGYRIQRVEKRRSFAELTANDTPEMYSLTDEDRQWDFMRSGDEI